MPQAENLGGERTEITDAMIEAGTAALRKEVCTVSDELRYVAEKRERESVVVDRQRKEIFCRVLAGDTWADADFARCKDIAEMFNGRPTP